MATFDGTPDPDPFTGTTGNDAISGLAGADTLEGGLGADTIVGGADDDTLRGDVSTDTDDDGADILVGGAGDDTLQGGGGNDLLTGDAGSDSIDGGAGTDILALTGGLGNYVVEEVTAPSGGAPGVYRLTDQREDSPEGSDRFSGIEKIRFEIGGERALADVLDRAPTDIRLSRVPATGAEVRENAGKGAVVAVLSGIDPDPTERFTFALVNASGSAANADGRFAIDGDKLVVAKDQAFDFEENGFHTVTLRVTDGAGNVFHKTLVVTVRDDVDVFTSFSAVLPADASEVGLWDQDDGTLVMTWRAPAGGGEAYFARRVEAGGASLDPAVPDRRLMEVETGDGRVPFILLGVDEHGVAAFVQNINDGSNRPDRLTWIDASSGDTVRTKTVSQSSDNQGSGTFADVYAFDDGLVGYRSTSLVAISASSGGTAYSPSSASSSETTFQEFRLAGPQTSQDRVLANTTGTSLFVNAPGILQTTESRRFVDAVDWNENGAFVYAEYEIASKYVFNEGTIAQSTALKGSVDPEPLEFRHGTSDNGNASSFFVFGSAILDDERFAYLPHDQKRRVDGEPAQTVVFSKNGRTTEVDLSGPGRFIDTIETIGTDKYLVAFQAGSPTGLQTRVQIFDDAGRALTDLLSFAGRPTFVTRDDGSIVAYTTRPSSNSSQPGTVVDGQLLLSSGVIATPNAGAFSDQDGDGDLDFAGLLFVGDRNGEQQSLRLEGGTYELTEQILKVANATVYANIGEDTGSPIFKGSFTLDRATGIASDLVLGQLPSGETPLTLAGLTPVVKGLTVRKDGAALAASFQLPSALFGDAKLDLNAPNALLINRFGPELEGFEVTIGTVQGSAGAAIGAGLTDAIVFNLFEAKAKNLKVRYDGAQEELAFSGELELKSDIIEGLGSLVGLNDLALTFKDLKIRNGLIDFEGELSAKSKWALGPIKLTDVKLGLKIDDSVVQSVGGEFGLELPFKQLSGLSFAGQFLLLPEGSLTERLFLNKIGVTATTSIPLPDGFFLDKIGATIDNLAPSPPEPTPTPTLFSGLLGIGWGPKLPTFPASELFGIAEVKDPRPINIELTAATDLTTSISGTGKINLTTDGLAKHTGAINWDFARNTVTFSGGFDYLSGVATGQATLRVSELGFTASGTGTVGIPNSFLFGPLAGVNIASASVLAQALADGNAENDVLAQWGTVTVPVIGTQTVGFKLDLNTGLPSLILSANDLPKTNSFDVNGTEDWLMLSAAWENDALGPVLTRVRPPGTAPGDPDPTHYIQEADYAQHGITVVDLYTGSRTKTVVIDDPGAGNWDLQVIDAAGLGTVHYKGFSPNPAVAVTVDDVSLVLGDLVGHVDATVAGADPGTLVTFWADTDGAGLDGFALGSATADADGPVGLDFDATLLSGGTYTIYAVADDGHGAPAFDYGDTFAVAHRPTGVALEALESPALAGAAGLVAETALPGAVVGTLAALGPDNTETYAFSLLDDAGGRFAVANGALVVGTGAPLSLLASASHAVTVRATSSQGLSVDQAFLIEVGPGDERQVAHAGVGGTRDALLGMDLRDLFFEVESDDTVIGGDGDDVLYLDGLRSDFELVIDRTGAIAGPVHASALPADFDPALFLPSGLDPLPPYLVVDDLRVGGEPLVAAGIEIVQFRDQRIQVADLDNRAPVAVDDVPRDGEGNLLVLDEDTPVVIDVRANDSDPDGGPFAVLPDSLSASGGGAFVDLATGGIRFVPTPEFAGTATVTYRISDGRLTSDAATLTLTYRAVNDAPVAAEDTYDLPEDGVLARSAEEGVLANDTDPDGDALAATLVDGPAFGTLTLEPDGSFTYRPIAGYSGPDEFTYRVTDPSGASATALALIWVENVNDPIVAADDSYATREDTPLFVDLFQGVLANDLNPDGFGYFASVRDGPDHGTLELEPDGSFTYTPDPDFHGTDGFTYHDPGAEGLPVGTVTITVAPVNDAPVADDEAGFTTGLDRPLDIALATLLAGDTDADGDGLSVVLGDAVGGSVTIVGEAVRFTPAPGHAGPASFTYRASDGEALSNLATVSLTVLGDEPSPDPVTVPGTAGGETLTSPGRRTDWLDGADGDDVLKGGRGNDTLNGGAGDDQMSGGTEADTFLFRGTDIAGPSDQDRIYDLAFPDGDRIVLEGFGAGTFEDAAGLEVTEGGSRVVIDSFADLAQLVGSSDAVTAARKGTTPVLILTITDTDGDTEVLFLSNAFAPYRDAGGLLNA